MSAFSPRIERLQTSYDHEGVPANGGLIVPGTLVARLGLEALIESWVTTGSARLGRKILTIVAAMLAGALHIDRFDMLRVGSTQKALPFRVVAPSTIGRFLRSFTGCLVRQLDAV